MLDDVRGKPHAAPRLLLAHRAARRSLDIVETVDRLKDGMATDLYPINSYVQRPAGTHRQGREGMARRWAYPRNSRQRIASLLLTRAALDIADLAADRKRDVWSPHAVLDIQRCARTALAAQLRRRPRSQRSLAGHGSQQPARRLLQASARIWGTAADDSRQARFRDVARSWLAKHEPRSSVSRA